MVKSPCNNICTIQKNTRICVGCGRTIKEIVNWMSFNDNEKKIILSKLKSINFNNKKEVHIEKNS